VQRITRTSPGNYRLLQAPGFSPGLRVGPRLALSLNRSCQHLPAVLH
jgi:hypothetical protein